MSNRTCSIDGCGKPTYCRGWCSAHYQRWRAHGHPLAGGRARLERLPWPENLLSRMEPQPNGCIHFTGYLGADGYGRAWDGARVLAHRAAYEHFVGPIPEGMTIDHECHNADETCAGGPTCLHRRCVNVEHLAVKTLAENAAASPNAPANRTHCPQGHPYDGANTLLRRDERRECRTCARDRMRKLRASR